MGKDTVHHPPMMKCIGSLAKNLIQKCADTDWRRYIPLFCRKARYTARGCGCVFGCLAKCSHRQRRTTGVTPFSAL